MGIAAVERERDRLALIWRKPREPFQSNCGGRTVDGSLLGARLRTGCLAALQRDLAALLRLPPPQSVDAAIAHDREQPRADTAARGSERGG